MVTFFLGLLLLAPPAGVTGTWDVSSRDQNGDPTKAVLIVKAEGGALTGSLQLGERKIPLQKVEQNGDKVSLQMPYEDVTLTVKLTLTGDTMKGEWSTSSGETGPVNATRQAGNPLLGKWKVAASRSDGSEMKAELELKDDAGKIAAMLTLPDGMSLPLSETKLDSGNFTGKLVTDQGNYVIHLALQATEGKGTYQSPDGSNGSLKATR